MTYWYLSQRTSKPTKWHVRPAKTQISLGICQVWSVVAICMKKAWVLSYPLSTQGRLIRLVHRLSWVFAWHTCYFVVFVVRCLIFLIFVTHALVGRCDIGVPRPVRLFVHPFVNNWLVSATPPTVFGHSFWNFTDVLAMACRCAYCCS